MEGSDEVAAAAAPAKRFISRNEIKQVRDREPVEVEVKDWGGFIRIVPMTGEMRQELEDRVQDKYKELPGGKRIKVANLAAKTWRERMLVDCCVGDDGAPLFTAVDIPMLQTKNARPVAIISQEILRISGVTQEEQEEIEKNSEAAGSVAG